MQIEDGAVNNPFGIANWLISHLSAAWSYLTVGSPLSLLAQSPVSPAATQIELILEGPASDVPCLSKIWKELFTVWM